MSTGISGSFSGGKSDPIIGGYQLSLIPFPNRPKWAVYIRALSEDEVVCLFLNNVISTGRYELNFKTETQPSTLLPLNYGSYESSKDGEYVTTPEYTGFVTITRADTINYIVSGTFEFIAVNRKNPSKTTKITAGRFDVK